MRARLHERIEVVHEDSDLIVIGKAAGIISYPVEGDPSESAIQLIRRYWKAQGRKQDQLYLLHRLDKATAGLLVFAKTSMARQSLQKQFEHHSVVREYVAVTSGIPRKPYGDIKTLLGRDFKNQRAVSTAGRLAVTHYQVVRMNRSSNRALIRCRIHTGRTHQVRIHMAHIGAPILGDYVYDKQRHQPSKKRSHPERLALFADTLGFIHPRNNAPVIFRMSLPDELRKLV